MDVDLVEGPGDAETVLQPAIGHALLDRVAAGRRPVLRLYRPAPTVAFGRRDTFLPGFPGAVTAARRRGFAAVVRGAGGRAAAYDEGCLIFDEIIPAGESIGGIRERFAEDAERQAEALRRLGIDARVGEVPGEYCPGEFSVNARGRVKLIGAAERIVKGAWLHSSVVVVESATAIRAVLLDVYAALGLDWDPETTGAVADEATSVGLQDVSRAFLAMYAATYELTPASLSSADLERATELVPRHQPEPLPRPE